MEFIGEERASAAVAKAKPKFTVKASPSCGSVPKIVQDMYPDWELNMNNAGELNRLLNMFNWYVYMIVMYKYFFSYTIICI